MRLNLFYPAVVVIGLALVFLFRPPVAEELAFFGFAESNETAINYNYPVVVEEILVQPGQAVTEGETLLRVSRRKSKERLADQDFRIRQLETEADIWRSKKRDELEQRRGRTRDELARIDEELADTRARLDYQRSLAADLRTIRVDTTAYQPLMSKIRNLGEERRRVELAAAGEEARLLRQIGRGGGPYQVEIDRLRAEAAFEADQQVQHFTVTAPSDGLIGNVHVKEEQHVQSYETLITFYEPHSGIVRGYVHEDLTARVNLGEVYEVYSLKNPTLAYEATVTGLGSRIVSIPSRLRRIPDYETYGREVILSIRPDNGFLQKEKVGIRTQIMAK